MITIPKVQYITRDDAQYSHAEQARLMYSHGVEWVQIRMKDCREEEILREAIKAMDYARKFGKKLIMNDSIVLASELKAHGVHLGLKDRPVDVARRELGPEFIIGGTANTLEDIKLQVSRGADYVGVGPFRYTTTKKNLSPVIGLEGYKTIITQLREEKINTPIVAVGGITMNDMDAIIATGIQGVAISGALFKHYTEINNTTES